MAQFNTTLTGLADDGYSLSSSDLTTGNLVEILNDHLSAMLENHLGATRPTYAQNGTLWIDEVSAGQIWTLYMHHNSGDYDVEIGTIDLGETEGTFKAAGVSSTLFDTLDAVTDIETTDYIILGDSSDSDKVVKVLVEDLFDEIQTNLFDNLDEVTDIETTDYIIIEDSSDSDKVVKVLVQELEEMLTSDNDELVKVNDMDTTAGYLEDKLVAGDNITLTTDVDDNSTITIASSGGDAELDIDGLTDSLAHGDVADDDLFVIADVSTDDNDLKKITTAELASYMTTNLNFSELGEHHTALDNGDEFIVDTGSIQRITFEHLKERVLQTSNIGSLSLADLAVDEADNYLLWLDDNSSGASATNKSVSLSRLATYVSDNLDINGLTDALTHDATDTEDLLVGDDELIISDAAAGSVTHVIKKITVTELTEYMADNISSSGGDAELDINGLTNALTDSTMADDDLFVIADVSTTDNDLKKVTAEDLAEYMTGNISLGAGLRVEAGNIVLDIRVGQLANVTETQIADGESGSWTLALQKNDEFTARSMTLHNFFEYFGLRIIEDLASDADPIAHEIVSVSSDGEHFYRTSLSTLVNHVAFENLDINDLTELTTSATIPDDDDTMDDEDNIKNMIDDADEFLVSDASQPADPDDATDSVETNVVKKITASNLRGYCAGTNSSTVTIIETGHDARERTLNVLYDSGRVRIGGNLDQDDDTEDNSEAYRNVSLTSAPFNIDFGDYILLPHIARVVIFFSIGEHPTALGSSNGVTTDVIHFRQGTSSYNVQGASRNNDGVFTTSGTTLTRKLYPYTQQVLVAPPYLTVPVPNSDSSSFPMNPFYDPQGVSINGMYVRRGDGTPSRNGYYLPFSFYYDDDDNLNYRYFQINANTMDISDTDRNSNALTYMRVLLM